MIKLILIDLLLLIKLLKGFLYKLIAKIQIINKNNI